MNNQIYTIISGAESANDVGENIWSVTLDPGFDEGPFDIHVSQRLPSGTLITVTLYDVLFRNVWVDSGQSNTEMTVTNIFNGTEEITNAKNYPKIQLFTATRIPSGTPYEVLPKMFLSWSIESSQSVGGTAIEL